MLVKVLEINTLPQHAHWRLMAVVSTSEFAEEVEEEVGKEGLIDRLESLELFESDRDDGGGGEWWCEKIQSGSELLKP